LIAFPGFFSFGLVNDEGVTEIGPDETLRLATRIESAKLYFRQFAFCILREIAVHHPVVVGWFFFENGGDFLAFMFSEIKDLFSFFVTDHPAGQVNHICRDKPAEDFHVVLDLTDLFAGGIGH
jgi:hypothetical protein